MTIKELYENMDNMKPLDFCFMAGLLLGRTKSRGKQVEQIREKVSRMLEEETFKANKN